MLGRKLIALVMALAMVMSTASFVFADDEAPAGTDPVVTTADQTEAPAKADQTIKVAAEKRVVVGRADKISAKLTAGDGKLTYATSDKNVVTVDKSGKIKAKAIGTATITITAAETKAFNAAVAEVKVNVVPKAITITSLVSLSYKRVEDSDALERVCDTIKEYAKSRNLAADLYSQSFLKDKSIDDAAADIGISAGKYEFLARLTEEENPDKDTILELTGKSTKELIQGNSSEMEEKTAETASDENITNEESTDGSQEVTEDNDSDKGNSEKSSVNNGKSSKEKAKKSKKSKKNSKKKAKKAKKTKKTNSNNGKGKGSSKNKGKSNKSSNKNNNKKNDKAD